MVETQIISLEDQIKQLAKDEGAVLVGICSAESIKDEIFSDPNYLLPGANSVITIAKNISEEAIRKYLSKEARRPLCLEEGTITHELIRIAEKIKDFLVEKGHKALRCDCNYDYRNQNAGKQMLVFMNILVDLINKEKQGLLSEKDEKSLSSLRMVAKNSSGQIIGYDSISLMPEFSHKCAAVASGLGRVGWSGNVLTEEYGARVLFNSVITDANLKPDKPLKENPCNTCKVCEQSCQGGMFSRDETQIITIAGVEETIAKRNDYEYCVAICTGFAGQNRFKEWSTWSPFRLDDVEILPRDGTIKEYVKKMFIKALLKGGKEAEDVIRLSSSAIIGRHNKPIEDFKPSCGYCQLVCGPTLKKTRESYNAIRHSR